MSRSLSTITVAVLVALAVGGLAWDLATGGAVAHRIGLSARPSTDAPGFLTPKAASVPAPDLRLQTLDGRHLSLHPDAASLTKTGAESSPSVVLVNFWATWCPPCRREIPDLIELQQSYGDEGLRVIGISLDRGDPEAVRRFAGETGINYPVVIDDGTAAEAFGGVPALPTTYLIGPDGRIRGRVPGLVTRETLTPALRVLLQPAEP